MEPKVGRGPESLQKFAIFSIFGPHISPQSTVVFTSHHNSLIVIINHLPLSLGPLLVWGPQRILQVGSSFIEPAADHMTKQC
ncbi:hypothetical protein HYC85_022600 [Camellia sinensis]|uniref:Uncharacterized protein n=1 Tax=Camellia sinensis TaxID=4442 RepID=A0A7J7GEI4_CAMSI|nr:hypothetical protein HYC85_022600 [Camellia sinensis]